MAFELIFETSIVNSYLIYKENYATDNITILQFHEGLVRSLLLGVPSENLKPGPREQSISYLKRKLADHKLEEKEGSAREVRRRCAGCHEKIREEESREPSLTVANKIKTFCADCDKFYCLHCFNEKHYPAKYKIQKVKIANTRFSVPSRLQKRENKGFEDTS